MTDLDELVTWLREQIHWTRTTATDAATEWVTGPDGDEMAGEVTSILVGAHIVLNDPRAVLAQCEAHTAMLAHALELDDKGDQDEHLVGLLALAYQHRPGYREEWRP